MKPQKLLQQVRVLSQAQLALCQQHFTLLLLLLLGLTSLQWPQVGWALAALRC